MSIEIIKPFVNDEQRRRCYAQAERDKKRGKKPSWDCEEFEHGKTRKKKSGNSKKSDSLRQCQKLLEEDRKRLSDQIDWSL